MKRIVLTVLMSVALGFAAFCQDKAATTEGHHIYVGVRGGANQFMLNSEAKLNDSNFYEGGAAKMSILAAIDVNYAYFWNEHWGIRTGINAANLMGKFNVGHVEGTLDNVEVSFPESGEGVNRISLFRNNANNLEETYSGYFFEVPLQLAWQGKKLYADFGVKFGLPFYFNATRRALADGDEMHYCYGSTLEPNWNLTEEQTLVEADRWENHSSRVNDGVLPITLSGVVDFGYRAGCTCGSSWMFGVFAEFGLLNTGDVRSYFDGYGDMLRDANNNKYDAYKFRGNAMRLNEGFAKLFNFGVKVQYDFAIGK